MRRVIAIIIVFILISGCIQNNNDEKDKNKDRKLYDYYEVQIIVDNFDNYSILLPVLPYTVKNSDYIISNISTNLKKTDISIITIYNVNGTNAMTERVLRINFSTTFTLKYKYEIINVSSHGHLSLRSGVGGVKEDYKTYMSSPNNHSIQIKLDTSEGHTEPEFQIIKNGWNTIILELWGKE